MRKETKTHLDNIVDTMAGADGGIRFIYLLAAIRSLDKEAAEGGKKAEGLLQVMVQFSDLINIIASMSGIGEKNET